MKNIEEHNKALLIFLGIPYFLRFWITINSK